MREGWRYWLLIVLSITLPASGAVLVVHLTRKTARDLIELRPWFFDAGYPESDIAGGIFMMAIVLAIHVFLLLCLEGGRARGGWLLPGLSILSSGVLLAICVIAFVRSAGRPTIEGYLGQLWNVTHEVPPPGVECPRPHPLWPVTTHPRPPGVPDRPLVMDYCPGTEGIRTVSIDGLGVLQVCLGGGCEIELAPSVEDLHARPESKSRDPIQAWYEALHGAPFQKWNHRLRFARDPSGRVLFLQDHDSPPPEFRPAFGRPREFHLVDGRWRAVEFSAERIAAKTSAPSAWLYTGLAGLALCGALHTFRRRVASRRRVLEAARPATLGEDGRLTFDDGTVVRVDPPPALAPGPVLVLRALSGSTYRENDVLSQKDIRAGSLEEQLAKLRFDLLRCDAATAAVACLTAAPLLGAAMAGLVI